MHPELVETLVAWKAEGHPPPFVSSRRPSTAKSSLERFLGPPAKLDESGKVRSRGARCNWEANGVRRFTPHGVRRLVVDELYADGADVGTVAELLGQSPAVALAYYRQATAQQKRRAITTLGCRPKGDEIDG